MTRRIFFFLLILLPVLMASAEESDGNTYPTAERLFYITRSVNRNLVCYDVRLADGRLDTRQPMEVYWINREERMGERNGLNYIQRKLAYGYKVVSKGEDRCECSLSAYPDRTLTIERKGASYVCYMTIDGQRALLRSLYVKTASKNPMSVKYVELRGTSTLTGQPITERIRK